MIDGVGILQFVVNSELIKLQEMDLSYNYFSRNSLIGFFNYADKSSVTKIILKGYDEQDIYI